MLLRTVYHHGCNALMQRFALVHDGSSQGWKVAYLAFHLSSRLGAPLLVLLVGPEIDSEMIAQRAAQVEVGGRAAGLVLTTRPVKDFSVEVVVENAPSYDGLILPRHLVQDENLPSRFLESLSYPLWIVTEESEMRNMAVLAGNATTDRGLMAHATSLSQRLQAPMIGLASQQTIASLRRLYAAVSWYQLPDFSSTAITGILGQLDVDILFLPFSGLSLVKELPINCVVYPA